MATDWVILECFRCQLHLVDSWRIDTRAQYTILGLKLHILEPNGTFIVAAVITAFGFSNGVSVCAVPGATVKEYLI